MHNSTDYVGGEGLAVRWTEVFFLRNDADTHCLEPVDLSQVSESLAGAMCVALTPHLKTLREEGLCRIGLRVTLHPDTVSPHCLLPAGCTCLWKAGVDMVLLPTILARPGQLDMVLLPMILARPGPLDMVLLPTILARPGPLDMVLLPTILARPGPLDMVLLPTILARPGPLDMVLLPTILARPGPLDMVLLPTILARPGPLDMVLLPTILARPGPLDMVLLPTILARPGPFFWDVAGFTGTHANGDACVVTGRASWKQLLVGERRALCILVLSMMVEGDRIHLLWLIIEGGWINLLSMIMEGCQIHLLSLIIEGGRIYLLSMIMEGC